MLFIFIVCEYWDDVYFDIEFHIWIFFVLFLFQNPVEDLFIWGWLLTVFEAEIDGVVFPSHGEFLFLFFVVLYVKIIIKICDYFL